jgi:hypothetical protein
VVVGSGAVGCVGGQITVGAIVVVGWMGVCLSIVLSVCHVCTMLLPQALFVLVACAGAVTEVMVVATSPTLHLLVFRTL